MKIRVTLKIRVHPNHGEQPAGDRTLFAIAEEEIGAAGGAEVIDKDISCLETSIEQLSAIGFAKIEVHVFGRRLMTGWHHVQPLKGIRLIAGTEFVEPFGRINKL